jgi:hypothetical protein
MMWSVTLCTHACSLRLNPVLIWQSHAAGRLHQVELTLFKQQNKLV